MPALVPLLPSPAQPAVVEATGDRARPRFLEFFASAIRNPHTRRAYVRAAMGFLDRCAAAGVPSLAAVQPLHVATWIEGQTRTHAAPTVKQRLAAIRHLFDWLVTGQIVPTNPAGSVRGPSYRVKTGKTPGTVIGIGHAAFDSAIEQAQAQGAALGVVAGLAQPVVVARVFERVTESAGTIRYRVFGVEVPSDGTMAHIVSDDALLVMLNVLKARGTEPCRPVVEQNAVEGCFIRGMDALSKALPGLKLPFKVPDVQPLGMLWPGSADSGEVKGLAGASDRKVLAGGDAN